VADSSAASRAAKRNLHIPPPDPILIGMDYRSLGRTGVKVSPLCLGCLNFGSKADLETSYRIIDRALEAGINFLDTANVYGRGKSEQVTGAALKRNGRRDRVVLATKVHGRMDDHDPNAAGNSRRHIISECEASLRRLQTDYIDLYQIHRPQSDIPADETLRALDDLIRTGKVRYAGSSTYAAWQLMESLMVSREEGLHRFVCEQPPYNLLDRRIERELIPFAQTYGVALIPWSPLGGGLLTGRYTREVQRPADLNRYKGEDGYLNSILTEGFFDRIGPFCELAKAKGCSPSQLALAWCLHRPGVTSPIIGPRTMEHLEDQLKALEVALTPADHKKLDELFPPGGMISSFYSADFGPHLYR
jgi:aryl-alcohol dehydrogenase-like predicted oxidoreductase